MDSNERKIYEHVRVVSLSGKHSAEGDKIPFHRKINLHFLVPIDIAQIFFGYSQIQNLFEHFSN